MSRLVLHAGLHKTGSTAVQTWFARNAAALDAAGIAFPVHLGNVTGNAPLVARALLTRKAELDEAQAKIRADFLEFCLANRGRDILLSAEYFEVPLFVDLRHAEIEAAVTGKRDQCPTLQRFEIEQRRNIKLLKRFAKQAGVEDIRLIYLQRNTVDKRNSAYAQKVKTLYDVRLDAEIYDRADKGYTILAETHRSLEAEGIEVRGDVTGAGGLGVVDQVMALAGLGDKIRGRISTEVETVNATIGEIGVLAAAQAYRVLEDLDLVEDLRLCRVISTALQARSAGMKDRRFSAFGPEAAQKMAEGQERLDALMARDFGADRLALLRRPKNPVEASCREPEDLPAEARAAFQTLMEGLAEDLCPARLKVPTEVIAALPQPRRLNLTLDRVAARTARRAARKAEKAAADG